MIAVQNLTRRFGRHVAVDDLTFSLERGEVVGFLGPNGAGKTTTMRMLTGFLPATSATRLEIAGLDVLRDSLEVRKRIGYLPESVPLYRELRVREMLLFQGRLHGLSRKELRERVPAVLERVGVLDREAQLVGKLSRGLRQRVGLAVALLPNPEVLILDEPTSGLDPIQRKEVRALVRGLAEEHTVLLSSHILAEVEGVCPRVIILSEGRLVADGTQDSLVAEEASGGHVRFEAVVGPDPDGARVLLASLAGVNEVRDLGRSGIHHAFSVHGEGDLREDVGALAATKGWAVRELSFDAPSLEEIFTRRVLGRDGEEGPVGLPTPAPTTSEPAAEPVQLASPFAPETPAPAGGDAPPLGTPGRKKVIYSLNPFDQGASRNLGAPMAVEPAESVQLDLPGSPGEVDDAAPEKDGREEA